MIHDAEIEISCDNHNNCTSSVRLPCTWSVGGYDLKDEKAEQMLESEHGWIVVDGSHYCCEWCKEERRREARQ